MSWYGDNVIGGGCKGCSASVTGTRKRERCAVLVIGYGNTLRGDDGVGPAIVERLAETCRDAAQGAFLAVHQLMPELAEDISACQRVLFVDASVEIPAGKVAVRRVQAQDAQRTGAAPLGHHASPAALLALSTELYGRAPQAWSIGVGVSNLEVGDSLSPLVSRAANRLCRRMAYRIRQWCRTPEDGFIYKDGSHVCQ